MEGKLSMAWAWHGHGMFWDGAWPPAPPLPPPPFTCVAEPPTPPSHAHSAEHSRRAAVAVLGLGQRGQRAQRVLQVGQFEWGSRQREGAGLWSCSFFLTTLPPPPPPPCPPPAWASPITAVPFLEVFLVLFFAPPFEPRSNLSPIPAAAARW